MILERMIQKIYPDKWEELEEIDKRYNAVEKRLGFPPTKKRYRSISGSYDTNTLIVEREWESFTAMDAAYIERNADPEAQELFIEIDSIIKSMRCEFYFLLE
jgi:hypothetical protein